VSVLIDNFVKVVEALAHLLGAVAWPIAAVIALRWFGPTLAVLLSDKSDVSLSGLGFSITAKRETREAIALAEATKVGGPATAPTEIKNWKAAVGKSYAATKWINQLRIDETLDKAILWVDDKPLNNVFEREAFEKLGMKIDFAKSTSEALDLLKKKQYDAVISDMSRPEGPRSGYDLLAKLKLIRPTVPFVLYSSSNTPEQAAEIIEAGAFGSTTKASDLIRLVTDAVRINDRSMRGEPRFLQSVRNLLAHRVTKSERIFD
jgi:CheY-like chemotaxis protein